MKLLRSLDKGKMSRPLRPKLTMMKHGALNHLNIRGPPRSQPAIRGQGMMTPLGPKKDGQRVIRGQGMMTALSPKKEDNVDDLD